MLTLLLKKLMACLAVIATGCVIYAVCKDPPKDSCKVKDKQGKCVTNTATATATATQSSTSTRTNTSTSTSTQTQTSGYPFPAEAGRVCTVDRFQQASSDQGRVKKLDILFVQDHSGSMADDWARMASNMQSLVKQLPADVDIKYAVLLANASSKKGKLYAPSNVPVVLSNQKFSVQNISSYLGKTFSAGMNVSDDLGSGEAAFLSLYHATTTYARDNQKLGFFRPDAALSVIFMSDEQEIGFPFPKVQAAGLPARCDAAYEDNVKKVQYDAKGINLDVAFNAVKALKGDMPVMTHAFVNITKEDLFTRNAKNSRCLYDSLGYGYFEMVEKTKGVLFSIQANKAEGLKRCGDVIRERLELQHEFKLSKASDKVDPATILAAVDAKKVAHEYKVNENIVYLADAGKAGSRIEIRHCEPVVRPNWNLLAFTGQAGQRAASLNWKTPEYATGGKVLYGTSAGALNGAVAHDGRATDHVVTVENLSPNTLYYFQAVSSDEYGLEKRSDVISLRTQPDWSIVASAGQPSRNSVSISFRTPEYATVGKVLYGASADALVSASAESAAATDHAVTIEGLNANSVYYFQALARDEYGLEKKSNVVSVRTLNEWGIVGFAGTPSLSSVGLVWQTPEYATSATVLYGANANALSSSVIDSSVGHDHQLTVGGLAQNTIYYFQVVARDDLGLVKRSPVLAVRTTYDWNIVNFAGSPAVDHVSIAFATPDFETSGQVRYGSTAESLSNVVSAGNGHDHAAVIGGLSDDTVYYFQAVATDANGRAKATGVVAIRTEKKPVDPTTPTDPTEPTGPTDTATNTATDTATDTSTVTDTATDTSTDTSTSTNTATDPTGPTNPTDPTPMPAWTLSNFLGTGAQGSVALSFKTSEYATLGKVRYGLSADSLSRELNGVAAEKDHFLNVGGLNPDTLYYFQAVASDEFGQTKESTVIAVRTLPSTTVDPSPVGSWEVKAFDATTTATTITGIWVTPGAATKATVKVGLSSTDLSLRAVEVSDYTETHSVSVTGLSPNTTYFIQVVASDRNGRTVESVELMKKTKAQ